MLSTPWDFHVHNAYSDTQAHTHTHIFSGHFGDSFEVSLRLTQPEYDKVSYNPPNSPEKCVQNLNIQKLVIDSEL